MADRRVWIVYSAQDGSSYELPLPTESTVEQLQASLAEMSLVPLKSQVLINESGVNVRPGMRLTSPRHQSPIFMFDLKFITSTELQARRRSSSDLGICQEPKDPPPRAPEDGSLKDDTEREQQLINTLAARAEEMCESAVKSVSRQTIMARALLSARANLVGHAAYFCRKFTAFNEELERSFKQYDQIMAACDTGFEALEQVSIPLALTGAPAEGSQLSMSMSESTVVQNMQSIRSYVAGALQQLKGRFSELTVTNMETSARLEVEMDMSDLEPQKGTHFTKLDEQINEMTALRDAQRTGASEESGVEPTQTLALMYKTNAEIESIQRAVLRSFDMLQQEMQTRMQQISRHQSQIQKMAKSISGYRDSLQSLDRYFGELEHVPHIGPAFKAGIVEVQRRLEFREMYSKQAQACMDAINALVEKEIDQRRQFDEAHGKHLPPVLIPGLAERPPTLTVEIPKFDSQLPALEHLPAALEDAEGPSTSTSSLPALTAAGDCNAGEAEGASELKEALAEVRRERDEMEQSMIKAQLKLSEQEAQAGSTDEKQTNSADLESQLGDHKRQLAQTLERLDSRSTTLQMARSILGMPGQTNSGYSEETTGSDSAASSQCDDAALLEKIRAQRDAYNEVEALKEQNRKLTEQLSMLTATSATRVSVAEGFEAEDLVCFLRRRPKQMIKCTQSDVYEAIMTGSSEHCFLDLDGIEMNDEQGEKPRLVMGKVTECNLLQASVHPENNTTDFGLPEGTAYTCVKLTEIKRFT